MAAVPVVAADGGRPGPGDDVVRPRQDGRGLRAADAAVGAVDDLGDLAVVGEAVVRRRVAVVGPVSALQKYGRKVERKYSCRFSGGNLSTTKKLFPRLT